MATNPFLDAVSGDATSTSSKGASSAAPGESKWFNFKPVNPFAFSFTGTSKPGNAELAVEEDDDGDVEKGKASPQKGSPSKSTKEDARERELRKREEELAKREAQLHEAQRLNHPRIPNFPVCWPLMYHNINVTSRDFGVSIMYIIVITVASFYLWYRPVYNAFMKDSSMLFYFYFFFGGWHCLFVFYMALGIPSSGSSGIINTISVVTDSKIVSGIFCSVSSSMWLLSGLVSLYLYKRTHYYYRVKGLTADDARKEVAKGVAGSGIMQGIGGAYIKSTTGIF
ncbi:hypothetical protein HDU67_009043 [Dinochytrium kinnereticum]|nr:hypothetical protein HDU67_009043 [Dinochytrium kinnereticum]